MRFFLTFLLGFAPRLAFLDAPEVWQFGFQDPATPIAQGIQDFHNDVCFFYGGYFDVRFMDAWPHYLAF